MYSSTRELQKQLTELKHQNRQLKCENEKLLQRLHTELHQKELIFNWVKVRMSMMEKEANDADELCDTVDCVVEHIKAKVRYLYGGKWTKAEPLRNPISWLALILILFHI